MRPEAAVIMVPDSGTGVGVRAEVTVLTEEAGTPPSTIVAPSAAPLEKVIDPSAAVYM